MVEIFVKGKRGPCRHDGKTELPKGKPSGDFSVKPRPKPEPTETLEAKSPTKPQPEAKPKISNERDNNPPAAPMFRSKKGRMLPMSMLCMAGGSSAMRASGSRRLSR